MQRESSGLDLGTKNALLELQNAHMREKVEEAAVRVSFLAPVYENVTPMLPLLLLDV